MRKQASITVGIMLNIAASLFGVAHITAARAALEAVAVKFDGETETIEGMVNTATF